MSLSFFRALNPVSKNSGIVYALAGYNPCQGQEMIDTTTSELIKSAFKDDLDYFQGLNATFDIITGGHYDLYLKGRSNCNGGAKGVLDFLIFPLVARKLIADTYLDERRESDFSNTLAWMIAVPLEMTRFSAGVALTLLLSPIVAIVHIAKNFMAQADEKTVEPEPMKLA